VAVTAEQKVPALAGPGTVLLAGVVGSTAYGLARAGSDIDRLGLFAAPTRAFHGLQRPQESHVTTGPDQTFHEAAKWLRLALACNPTVLELAWLPTELYEIRTTLGDELVGMRGALLSARRVRNAYLGYATSQFQRLRDRGDGSFSADTRKRTAKHARHLKRLCLQGYELYVTGHLTLEVLDPQAYFDFGDRVAADPSAAEAFIAQFEDAFDTARTALPDAPDEVRAEAWLHRVRDAHYSPPAP